MLKDAGFDLDTITLLKDHETFGAKYKSRHSQAVAHGNPEHVVWGEIHFIIRHKRSGKVALLLHDLNVTLVDHLGLHIAKRTGSQSVIKMEDLIAHRPLNLYATENDLSETICYLTLSECLPFYNENY